MIRRAVNDGKSNVFRQDGTLEELNAVPLAEKLGRSGLIFGQVCLKTADTYTDYLHAVALCVQAAQHFPTHFADALIAGRTGQIAPAYSHWPITVGDLVGAGKHQPFHAFEAGRFKNMIGSNDVCSQDGLP